ncbi:MAG: DUF302 domain-containing protein [Anaerolineae bacterium]|nr:DUF302 domain-containing protein [Anaerolineae bacterium]
MTQAAENLGMTTILNSDMASAEAKVTDVLKAEGFGILTQIDVQATFKKKLDVDFRPYKILGACNPKLAHQALTATSEVGLLLPCNVTLAQVGDNQVEVSFIDPIHMMSVIDDEGVVAVAEEAREKLERAFNNLQA